VVEDLPPAVEPSKRFRAGLPILDSCPFSVLRPAQLPPTPGAAADAAALLELAGGDAGTLAALRELLG
jgi:hypothetical protein